MSLQFREDAQVYMHHTQDESNGMVAKPAIPVFN